MISALTLPLGWWMVPTLITIIMFYWAHQCERELSGSLLAGMSYVIAMIPVLLVWCLYLSACLILR